MTDHAAHLAPTDDAYNALLADLRAIIAAGRGRAATAVNVELVLTYWSIGERIVREEQGGAERAAYGAGLLARLGRTLGGEFGRGFAEVSLQNMRRFYLAYPISSALRRELTWTHYRTLMRLDTEERRAFYERIAVTGRWSSRELDNWKRRSCPTSNTSCSPWATASASSGGNSASPSATKIIMSISSSTTASCGRRSWSI